MLSRVKNNVLQNNTYKKPKEELRVHIIITECVTRKVAPKLKSTSTMSKSKSKKELLCSGIYFKSRTIQVNKTNHLCILFASSNEHCALENAKRRQS